MLYLFVHPAQLSVLVEQQQFLLVSGGDSHTLCDQGDLLLRGQQPVTHGTHILRPARKHTHTHTHKDTDHTCTARQRICAINKVTMKNISRGFPLISKHICAQKNVRVLLNTHSHRVHLQRIESELLCTPTHTHACTVTLCTQDTQTHTHTHTHTLRAVHLSAVLANQNLCLLSDVFAYR